MKKLIAGNWKMHKTIAEGVAFVNEIKGQIKEKAERGILICAPATMIAPMAEAAKGSKIMIGAENMYFEEKGAFTGEISPLMVKDAGATHVLLGHSERRTIFGESNELINKKMKSALTHDIVPVLCIGELLEEREAGKLKDVLTTQLTEGFKGIDKAEATKTIVAYEPVWAIGTGKTASSEDANDAHHIVREILTNIYDAEFAKNMIVLYGGSVKGDNVDELMSMEHIDGALVGGASLETTGFARIVNYN